MIRTGVEEDKPSILIVDDEPLNIEVLESMILDMRNMRSDCALNS